MAIALIVGTGLDEAPEILSGKPIIAETRFGQANLLECDPGGKRLLVLPRHGLEHGTPPHLINYRANIAALRQMGVDTAIGICAVGSLRADLTPGETAILTDMIDFTKGPPITFSQEIGDAIVHSDVTSPYCPRITRRLLLSCKELRVPGGSPATYLGVSGPRYETPAEVRVFASWGADVVGMTNAHECILAREAGICYGAIALVTNLGTGISPEAPDHDDVRAAVRASSSRVLRLALHAFEHIADDAACICRANARKIAFE